MEVIKIFISNALFYALNVIFRFQIELQDAALVRGIITQGRDGCCQQWVNKYRVLYSEDCKSWHTLGGFNVTDMVNIYVL